MLRIYGFAVSANKRRKVNHVLYVVFFMCGELSVSRIIVEIEQSPEADNGCWGIKVSNEGGGVFFKTGYVYEGDGSATRAFCKILEHLPEDKATIELGE